MMGENFLLIINRNGSTSLESLREALTAFGDLKVDPEEDALDEILQQNYNLVIVDASSVNEPAQLITEILRLKPSTRIVVTSVAPTWQEIRSVLTAGAIDFVRLSVSRRELFATIEEALSLPLEERSR
jgi:DNA-binding NarL/FixJ family response regulator